MSTSSPSANGTDRPVRTYACDAKVRDESLFVIEAAGV